MVKILEPEKREECGVVALYLKPGVSYEHSLDWIYRLLWNNKNRGPLSTGFTSFNPNRRPLMRTRKKAVSVNELFGKNLQPAVRRKEAFRALVEQYSGLAFIGHTRYATSGIGDPDDEVQPFVKRHGRPWKHFGICFNGTIANYDGLAREMIADGYSLDTFVDTEILMHLFARSINELSSNGNGKPTNPDLLSINRNGRPTKPDLFEVTQNVMEQLDGAYSIANLSKEGDLILARDPLGMKPLSWAETPLFWAASSESAALEQIGCGEIHPVNPGYAMLFQGVDPLEKRLMESEVVSGAPRRAMCHFEKVYFSRKDSVIDRVPVHDDRKRLAEELAISEPYIELINGFPDDCVAVGVPNSGSGYARYYARALNILDEEAIIKSAGVSEDALRGFIAGDGDDREEVMMRDYGYIRSVLRNKHIFLVEDSLVRGETLKAVIAHIKTAQPASIHVRVADAPIISPCFYGIAMATHSEFLVNHFPDNITQRELEKLAADYYKIDSLAYNSVASVKSALRLDEDRACYACLTGNYPTLGGQMLAQKSLDDWRREKGEYLFPM